MIRTTYKGRDIKILKARRPGCVRTFVGGRPINHEWPGSEVEALDNLRLIIDRIDTAGGPGHNAAYWTPNWYAPGTYALNGYGHAIPLNGGGCPCDLCLMHPAKNVPAGEAA